MEVATERRADGSPRVPIEQVLIELSHEGFDEAFEADGVDLGPGGLSMHAAYLPEIGSRLRCRFASPTDGRPVEAGCEVVWARDSGPQVGRFGLRFVDLDPESRDAIRGLVDRPEDRSTDPDDSGPPEARLDADAGSQSHSVVRKGVEPNEGFAPDRGHVTLRVDGASSTMDARVVGRDGCRVQLEQDLPLLSIGTGIEAEERRCRRGRIETVQLRVDDDRPKLVLGVSYDDEAPDTVPDWAPDSEAPSFSSGQVVSPASDPSADAPDVGTTAIADRNRVAVDAADGTAAETAMPPARSVASEPASRELEPTPNARMDGPEAAVTPSRLPSGSEDAVERVSPETPSVGATIRAMVVAWIARMRTLMARTVPLARRARDEAVSAWQRLAPARAAFRRYVVRGAKRVGRAVSVGARIARGRVRAFALTLRERMGGPGARSSRRRTTAPPPRASNVGPTGAKKQQSQQQIRGGEGKRTLLLSLLAFAGAGLTVYALTPAAQGGTADARSASGESTEKTGAQSNGAAASGSSRNDSAKADGKGSQQSSKAQAAQEQSPELQEDAKPQEPGTVPSSSPYADAEGEKPEATTEEAGSQDEAASKGSRAFGAESVPDAKSFMLRMSQPVDTLEGVADDSGFTVDIPGSLSLDRAGPIAAKHPAIDRSMILNRGDHAELTVRFADGRQPSYRVVGRGRAVEILIEQ